MNRLIMITCALVLIVGFALPSSAQTYNTKTATLNASGSACTQADSSSSVNLRLNPTDSSGTLQISGTFSGTATFQASASGGQQWTTTSAQPLAGGALVSTATAAGAWQLDVASLTNICVYVSSYTSGNLIVSLSSSPARGNIVTSSVVKTQVDAYTSAGIYTWNKPTGAIAIDIYAIGGGGAGGAGIVSTAAGGGGGGGGGCAVIHLNAASIGATMTITVGTGGIGGSTKANAGSSTVVEVTSGKTLLTAGLGVIGIDASSNSGGGGGGGGSMGSLVVAANSSPGTQGAGYQGAGGGTGATTGGIGGKGDQGGGGGGGGKNATAGGAGGTSSCGGGGGGGGASTGTAGAGGVGGQGAAGGTSQGGSATTTGVYTLGGSGGAGGAQTTQTGGNGAVPGGGGGGGGNLATSGGNGGDGAVTIISYF